MTIENPPAFPLGVPHMTEYQPEWGMTLRDYYAAAALTGMLASEGNGGGCYPPEWAGERAYVLADAMLTARLSPHSVIAGGE